MSRERVDDLVAALREGLEVVTVSLAAPGGGRPKIDDHLLVAMSALDAFLDRKVLEDALLADLDRAGAALASAAAAADEHAGLEVADARALLAEARNVLLEALAVPGGTMPPPPPAEMRASRGVPAIHAFVVPPPRLFDVEGADDEDEDGDDAPTGGRERAATPELAMVRSLARECIEDVASFGSLRRLWDEEPWSDAEPFEKRLLATLDALASLDRPLDPTAPHAHVVEEVWRFATEWSVPDLGRAFALAFVLACSEAGSGLRGIALGLRRTDRRVHASFVEALVLGSNPGIDTLVAELCRDDDPAIAEVGFRVAARRGVIDPVPTVIAFGLQAAVARAAISAAVGLPPELASGLVDLVDRGGLAEASAAASTLVTMGASVGPAHARRLLDDSTAGAATPAALDARASTTGALATLGDSRDIDRLQAVCAKSPDLGPWLAIHGFAAHMPFMGDLLTRAEQRRELTLARALARGLTLLSGEDVAVTAVDEENAATGFDVAACLASPKARILPGGRLLLGQTWTVSALCDELARPGAVHVDRRRLAGALATATRGAARIDTDGWVARQRKDIALARRATR